MSDPPTLEEAELYVQAHAEHYPSLLEEFVGSSPEISRVRDLVRRFAPTNLPILLVGEPGTGKTSLARHIHRLSNRRSAPFIVVSLAMMSRDLASSQLFGHVKGAFTGAFTHKRGLVEAADRGTLFLDSVDDASIEVQALLPDLLTDQRFMRLGAIREVSVDLRIISSVVTTTDRIRQDLLSRLSGVIISLPPLRNRPEDISELAEAFLKRSGTHTISADAMARLRSYSFPGNVRELISILRRAEVTADTNTIGEDDLSLGQHAVAPTGVSQDALAELSDARAKLDVYQRAAIMASPIWEGRNFATENDYCFVLMPFSDVKDLPAVYQNHVKPVLEKCGLRSERADDIHDISGIMQSVWESINKARLVIAEMTERNPNVFYELGIAHTLGKQVIMITQSMDYVPFDLKHLRCIVYDYKPTRIEKFEAALEKTVKTVLSSTLIPSWSLIKSK